jgi:hypothetical protein
LSVRSDAAIDWTTNTKLKSRSKPKCLHETGNPFQFSATFSVLKDCINLVRGVIFIQDAHTGGKP